MWSSAAHMTDLTEEDVYNFDTGGWLIIVRVLLFFGLLLTQTMYNQTNCLNLGTGLAQIQVSDTLLLVTAPTKRATY